MFSQLLPHTDLLFKIKSFLNEGRIKITRKIRHRLVRRRTYHNAWGKWATIPVSKRNRLATFGINRM